MLISSIRYLLSLRVVVVCLLLLMVLVFWGTVYQVEHGLWAAQQRYFASWVVLIGGFIPFPGAQLVLAVLFVSLTLAMMYRFALGWRQLGIVCVHLGLMLMLAGGWVTQRYGQESFLSLAEGEGSNLASSYRDWELSIWTDPGNVRTVTAFDAEALRPGTEFAVESLELRGTVLAYDPNCRVDPGGATDPRRHVHNAGGLQRLMSMPRNKDPQSDVPGLRISVRRGGGDPYEVLLYGGDDRPTVIGKEDQSIAFSLRRKRYPLPVFVELDDFQKAFHPNTETPKRFASAITVHAGEVVREVLVEMNEPFRFGGYTFYQASYGDLGGGRELSTFAVTKNLGRLVPYIATGMTVFGLVLHFCLELVIRGRRPAPTVNREPAHA